MEQKKADSANLERYRWKFFLLSVLLIVSFLYVLLQWRVMMTDDVNPEFENFIEEMDISKLKEEMEMVPAARPQQLVETPKKAEQVDDAELPDIEELLDENTLREARDATLEETTVSTDVLGEDKPLDAELVDILPEFPGGPNVFMKWITEHLVYPTEAVKSKLQGRVVVSFIINADGTVSALQLKESANPTLGNAVLRTLSAMPNWKPGEKAGKPCRTMIAIPIIFQI